MREESTGKSIEENPEDQHTDSNDGNVQEIDASHLHTETDRLTDGTE